MSEEEAENIIEAINDELGLPREQEPMFDLIKEKVMIVLDKKDEQIKYLESRVKHYEKQMRISQ